MIAISGTCEKSVNDAAWQTFWGWRIKNTFLDLKGFREPHMFSDGMARIWYWYMMDKELLPNQDPK